MERKRQRFTTDRVVSSKNYESSRKAHFSELERAHEEVKTMVFAEVSKEIPSDTMGWMPMFGTKMMPMSYGEAKSLGWEDKWSRVKYR